MPVPDSADDVNCVAVVDHESPCRSFGRSLRAAGFQSVTDSSAKAFQQDTKRPRFDCSVLNVQPVTPTTLSEDWNRIMRTIITAKWKASSSERWTVPVGAGVGKIVHLGKLPRNVQLAGYDNAEKPETLGADWQMRFQVQFLFPK